MDNRSKILDSALTLFSQKGYNAVGVQQVAQHAGVTKPTLYHYFGNKRGLLGELLKRHYTPFLSAVMAAVEYQGDLPATLQRLAQAILSYAKHNTTFYRMQLAMCFAPADSETYQEVVVYQERLHSMIIDLFQKAAVDHGNMVGRHQSYAVSLIGHLNTYAVLADRGLVERDEKTVYQIVHQFSHGIYS